MDKNDNNEESVKKNKQPDKITVVSGSGKDLNISKVYDHLNVDEPSTNSPEKHNVIIPKTKK